MTKTNEESVATKIKCVGFIMDGNRRWSEEFGLPTNEGHRRGYEKLKEVVLWVREAGIPHVVMYAFSTENWLRSQEEVGYLMQIFRFVLESEIKKIIEKRVRVRFVGDLSRFDEDMQKMMAQAEFESSAVEYNTTLYLAMSYGGRAEIVAAANTLLKEGKTSVSEEEFAQKLWSGDMPDPDLIIRTGGEKRLSNFLPWQTVYSELFFTDTKWPAFTKEEFNTILAEFSMRDRRGGK